MFLDILLVLLLVVSIGFAVATFNGLRALEFPKSTIIAYAIWATLLILGQLFGTLYYYNFL